MVFPVAILLLAGLILYSGLHNMPVTDTLRGVLGRQPQGQLGSLKADSSDTQAPGGTGPGVTATGTLSGHPELHPEIKAVVATILKQFPHLAITSTYRPGGQSYHARHEACDLAGGNMDAVATWIGQNLGSQLLEGIHNPTLSIKNGQAVPPSFWGASTWAAHINHIHVAAGAP